MLTSEQVPLVGLVIAAATYSVLVVLALRRGQHFPPARMVAFGAGLAVVAVALYSPLDPYGEETSLAAHMLQHELLLMVAPVLLVAGVDQRLIVPLTRRALGPAVRSRSWRTALNAAGNPFVVTAVWCAMVLGWHLPVLYDLALDNDRVHIVEHTSLLTVGIAFWVVVIGRLPSLHRTTTGQRVGALGGAMAASGALAAVLLWTPHVLYARYAHAQPWFGLTPLGDQRLAAVAMMAVDMPLLLGAALFVTARWARREVRRASVRPGAGGSGPAAVPRPSGQPLSLSPQDGLVADG